MMKISSTQQYYSQSYDYITEIVLVKESYIESAQNLKEFYFKNKN